MHCHGRYSEKIWYCDDCINNLCGRLSLLDENEQALLLSLTDVFKYVDLQLLFSDLEYVIKNVPVEVLSGKDSIFIAPLKMPLEMNEKSSDNILKIIRNKFETEICKGSSIIFCKSINELIENYKENGLIILCDDFIGSGKTVQQCVSAIMNELIKNHKSIKLEDFFILAVYAMQQGQEYLNALPIKFVVKEMYKRAISDDYSLSEDDRKKNIEIMKSSESKVLEKFNCDFSLGYEQCESLISILDKSPNNTFSIYWFRAKQNIQPIFPRKNVTDRRKAFLASIDKA